MGTRQGKITLGGKVPVPSPVNHRSTAFFCDFHGPIVTSRVNDKNLIGPGRSILKGAGKIFFFIFSEDDAGYAAHDYSSFPKSSGWRTRYPVRSIYPSLSSRYG